MPLVRPQHREFSSVVAPCTPVPELVPWQTSTVWPTCKAVMKETSKLTDIFIHKPQTMCKAPLCPTRPHVGDRWYFFPRDFRVRVTVRNTLPHVPVHGGCEAIHGIVLTCKSATGLNACGCFYGTNFVPMFWNYQFESKRCSRCYILREKYLTFT